MDATTLLRQDHNQVEKLFKQFETSGPRATTTRKRLVDRMIAELSVHAAVEEQFFYPAVRAKVDGAGDEVLESLEEHHVVKWLLSELEDLDPKAERFPAKVTVLMELVRHHIREEEKDLFPRVRKAFGRRELAELGEQLAAAKKLAPSRPHPRAADTPPRNLVSGLVAGVADKVSEVARR